MKTLKVTAKKIMKIEREADKALELLKYSSSKEAADTRRREIECATDAAWQEFCAPLDDHLALINGRASAHVLTAMDVVEKATEIERLLASRGVAQANIVGTEFVYRPAGKEGNKTYERVSGASITTRIHLRRIGDGWRLLEAARAYNYVNQKQELKIMISEEARADIVRRATKNMIVKQAA